VSEVGRRQREQRLERTRERESVVAEVRVVTREEMALERVAVRERRELAQEATGEDREAVLKRVEADRREQIERAQAAAERRVERRQGMGIGGRLLAQARDLRARIGQQLGRVKEWIAERFPDPLQRIKERSRDLFDTVVEKAQRALGRDAGQDRGDINTPTLKDGMFEGVRASAGPAEGFSAPTVATPAETAQMSLAEQLELRSNEVAARLDREARAPRAKGLEDDALRHQRGLETTHEPDRQDGRDARHAAGHDGHHGDGEVGQRTPDGSNDLTLAEQLQARADEVARRVGHEIAQDGAARAQRAEVERQRVHEETQEKKRGRSRSRGRFLGDDDEFTRGRGR
jgi:hypothetical protein